MKKLFAIGLIVFFCTCVSNPSPTGTKTSVSSSTDELDIAIREASDYLKVRIQPNTKAVFLNIQSNFPDLSEYILSILSENAVNDNVFLVVDRQQLDTIRTELNFHLSGEVSDESAQSIGQILGAQTIVSGTVTKIGTLYRLQIKAIAVQTAAIQGQWSRNIPEGVTITALTKNQTNNTTTASTSNRATTSNSASSSTQTTSVQTANTNTSGTVTSSTSGQAAQQLQIIIVEGATLTEKLQWIETNAVNNTEYRIEVNGNESISAPTLSYPRRRNITVRLISSGEERILSLTGSGSIFTIESDVTLILDNGITLTGRNQNNSSLVMINGRGTLIMNKGAKIFGNGNNSSNGGAVIVKENGIFTMTGGEIFDNIAPSRGGGVYVMKNGTFTMSGGDIYNNLVSGYSGGGGGVYVEGSFTMTGGEISKNISRGSSDSKMFNGGGGVLVSNGTFTMRGGEIYGNTSASPGGGVSVQNGTFTMTGGEISGNTAQGVGGGVYISGGTNAGRVESFSKTGGIIYGTTGINNDSNENRSSTDGHAVYMSADFTRIIRIRNSTAGVGVRLDPSKSGAAGGWEN